MSGSARTADGFALLRVADAWWSIYRLTGNTDHWCWARQAERSGLAALAEGNGSVNWLDSWQPSLPSDAEPQVPQTAAPPPASDAPEPENK